MPILLPLNSFLLWLGRVFLPVQHFRKQNAASDSCDVNTMHSSGIFRSTTWMTSICTNKGTHTWFLLRVLSWFIHLYLTLFQENYDIHNCWKRFHVTDWTSENFIYPGWHFLNSKIKKKSSLIDIWVYHSANEFPSNSQLSVLSLNLYITSYIIPLSFAFLQSKDGSLSLQSQEALLSLDILVSPVTRCTTRLAYSGTSHTMVSPDLWTLGSCLIPQVTMSPQFIWLPEKLPSFHDHVGKTRQGTLFHNLLWKKYKHEFKNCIN